MKPTLLICGYGPGIGHAVAERFGQAGHPLHLVARDADKLAAATQHLQAQGIRAQGTVCDLSDEVALQAMLQAQLAAGDIGLLHWNAFVDVDGDLLDASPAVLAQSLNLRVAQYPAAINPADVAGQFWQMVQQRQAHSRLWSGASTKV